jgi:hypothetical protein
MYDSSIVDMYVRCHHCIVAKNRHSLRVHVQNFVFTCLMRLPNKSTTASYWLCVCVCVCVHVVCVSFISTKNIDLLTRNSDSKFKERVLDS